MEIAGLPLSPLIALVAGVLILIMPRLLNYIVAIYLIIVGLLGHLSAARRLTKRRRRADADSASVGSAQPPANAATRAPARASWAIGPKMLRRAAAFAPLPFARFSLCARDSSAKGYSDG